MGISPTEVNLLRLLDSAPRQKNQAKLAHYVTTSRELLDKLAAENPSEGMSSTSKAKLNDYSDKIEQLASRLDLEMNGSVMFQLNDPLSYISKLVPVVTVNMTLYLYLSAKFSLLSKFYSSFQFVAVVRIVRMMRCSYLLASLSAVQHVQFVAVAFNFLGKMRNVPMVGHQEQMLEQTLPDKCPLCDQEEETVQHLLTTCVVARQVWFSLLIELHLADAVPKQNEHNFANWQRKSVKKVRKEQKKGLNSLIILAAWSIWKHCNACVFEGVTPSVNTILGAFKDELWCLA